MSPSAHTLLIAAALLLVLGPFAGCLTYSESLENAHAVAVGGDWPAAEARLNDLLGVDSREELPEPLDSDQALAVLERGMVLQAQGAWAESQRDLAAGEEGLEAIDFEHDAGGKLATYLYSASSANYAAPPVERMALNSFNMLNYLAEGRLQDAAVEARRYQVMRDFLETLVDDPPRGRFGAFLAGFVFEHLGEPERALRYYEEVLERGTLAALDAPVARLAQRTRWRGPAVTSALERARGSGDVPAAADPGARSGDTRARSRPDPSSSEILVVASLGRSPRKVPKRIPIGAAVGIAGAYVTGDLDILERSAFKVLVFPELEPVTSRVTGATVRVDGETVRPELLERLGNEVVSDYEKVKPLLIGQALSRLITRAAVAEGARVAGRETSGGSSLLGLVLALTSEAILVGLDKPDTRSWTFLPDQVLVARVTVPPGVHEVEVELAGTGGLRRQSVEVAPNAYATVIVTEPR